MRRCWTVAATASSGGAVAAALDLLATAAPALTLPAGFQDSVVASGLTQPTAVAFAPDGRMFVAEKSGLSKLFDAPGDPTPVIFANLRTNVHNFWDRGLATLALHPAFPAQPYVYVGYTLDAAIGGTPPRWGTAGATADGCPTPPGATSNGCVVGGRVSRLQAAGDTMVGAEQVLIEGWCQQFPSHSVDDLAFAADGALYVSGGDGANFFSVDYGQSGTPVNPCGDPPGAVGSQLTAPSARGGALRSQSLRRPAGEPAVLNGTVLRVDPLTGQALPDNPLVGGGIAGAERIIAYGLRNPFRLAVRPGTRELYVGDVGWSAYEEINRIADGADAAVENFGWPCYEGPGAQVSYQAAQLDQCRDLYRSAGAAAAPLFSYARGAPVVAGEACGSGGTNGVVEFTSGSVHRLRYFAGAQPPTAVLASDTDNGPLPLTVTFDGSGSHDPDIGDTLAYAWDLDGDGAFDDASVATPQFTYTSSGRVSVALRVTDTFNLSNTAVRVIHAGNSAPQVTMSAPAAGTQWTVGDLLTLAGSAVDAEDGPLPVAALSWAIVMHHCPLDCHQHPVEELSGAGGILVAPDHEYPSHLELRLTATDSGGLPTTVSRDLHPATVVLHFESTPPGLVLAIGSDAAAAPFTRTVIIGSAQAVGAPAPQSSAASNTSSPRGQTAAPSSTASSPPPPVRSCTPASCPPSAPTAATATSTPARSATTAAPSPATAAMPPANWRAAAVAPARRPTRRRRPRPLRAPQPRPTPRRRPRRRACRRALRAQCATSVMPVRSPAWRSSSAVRCRARPAPLPAAPTGSLHSPRVPRTLPRAAARRRQRQLATVIVEVANISHRFRTSPMAQPRRSR